MVYFNIHRFVEKQIVINRCLWIILLDKTLYYKDSMWLLTVYTFFNMFRHLSTEIVILVYLSIKSVEKWLFLFKIKGLDCGKLVEKYVDISVFIHICCVKLYFLKFLFGFCNFINNFCGFFYF